MRIHSRVGTLIAGAAIALGLTIAPLATTTATAAPKPAGEKVVFLIPGQQVTSSPRAYEQAYGALATSLRTAGYRVTYIPAGGLNVAADAALIKRTIDPVAKRASFVGIVAHSAGGLGGRYYLKFLDGAANVNQYVAIGTAQYGSPGGCSQPVRGGFDTCMYSDVIKRLNKGPDAPGPTRYSVVQSDGEWTDGRLDGTPQCRSYSPVPLANTGFDHTIEPTQPVIIANTITSLRGGCAGNVVTDKVDSFTWQSTLFPGFPPPARDLLRDQMPRIVPAPR